MRTKDFKLIISIFEPMLSFSIKVLYSHKLHLRKTVSLHYTEKTLFTL